MTLAGNGFSDHDADLWAEAIEENKYCKRLNLSRNYFGDSGGLVLGPAIGQSHDVTSRSYTDVSSADDLSCFLLFSRI